MTHNAILLHQEYVDVLERSVDQLHRDTVVATKNFGELHHSFTMASKSFTSIVGSLMTHLSDYKSKTTNDFREAEFRTELSALLRLHAQRLFAEMVTKDSVVADAAAVIAVSAERRFELARAGTFPPVGYNSRDSSASTASTSTRFSAPRQRVERSVDADVADTDANTSTATNAVPAVESAAMTKEDVEGSIDWSGDEEDSLGAEMKRIGDHLMRCVKRRRDRLESAANRPAPPSAIEQAIAFYADEPDFVDESGRRMRGKLPHRSVMLMKQWLFENWYHPYPSEAQKRKLGREAQLSLLQVNNWFTNARRRVLSKQATGGHSRPVESEVMYDPAHEAAPGGVDRGSTALMFASVGLPVPPFDVHLPVSSASSVVLNMADAAAVAIPPTVAAVAAKRSAVAAMGPPKSAPSAKQKLASSTIAMTTLTVSTTASKKKKN